MNCNHTLLDTPFCPNCGEATANDPLAGLLSHVNKHVYLNKERLDSTLRRRPDPHLSEEIAVQWQVATERQIAAETRLYNKWARWQARLMEILNAETKN